MKVLRQVIASESFREIWMIDMMLLRSCYMSCLQIRDQMVEEHRVHKGDLQKMEQKFFEERVSLLQLYNGLNCNLEQRFVARGVECCLNRKNNFFALVAFHHHALYSIGKCSILFKLYYIQLFVLLLDPYEGGV